MPVREYKLGPLTVILEQHPTQEGTQEHLLTFQVLGEGDVEPRYTFTQERLSWQWPPHAILTFLNELYQAAWDPTTYVAKLTGGGRYFWHQEEADRMVKGASLFPTGDIAKAALASVRMVERETGPKAWSPKIGSKEWSPRWPKGVEEEEVVNDITNSIARTLFVVAWADEEEREGRGHSGEELFDVAPATTSDAYGAAMNLVRRMEKDNRMSLAAMYGVALQKAKILQDESQDLREEFGYTTAMQALGTGVRWSDRYPKHDLKIPYIEFYL